MRDFERRLQRLEAQAADASAPPVIIRVVYEDALTQTRHLAPWHVEIQGGVSRVVHEGDTHTQL
jgi:hypothetical protein